MKSRIQQFCQPSCSAVLGGFILASGLLGCGSQAVQPGATPPTLTVPANRPPVAAQPQPAESTTENTTRGELGSVPVVSASSILGPNNEPTENYHKVQSGDTLSQIAQQHQVSLHALISENGLSTTTVLQPGQLLYIPERLE